jgi:Co/Zn/Cd efflux system component
MPRINVTDSCCQSPTDVAALQARQRRTLVAVLAINAATFLMMILAAMFSGSSSLLSGALDNFGDALTYALSLMVVGASSSAKARVAFFKGLLIFGAAVLVAVQIGWRLLSPAMRAPTGFSGHVRRVPRARRSFRAAGGWCPT